MKDIPQKYTTEYNYLKQNINIYFFKTLYLIVLFITVMYDLIKLWNYNIIWFI